MARFVVERNDAYILSRLINLKARYSNLAELARSFGKKCESMSFMRNCHTVDSALREYIKELNSKYGMQATVDNVCIDIDSLEVSYETK